jgi:hypothetical protein
MNALLKQLPKGMWSACVRAQRIPGRSLKEACDLAYAHLILQHGCAIEPVAAAHLEAIFLQPHPTIALNNEATETMPAVILERRLKWKKS